jgi:hypothetical protein
MTMIEIPIASAESRFEQENNAFSQSFTFEFEWIEREGFWMLHIFDANRTPLALGVKVQPDWPLYAHHLRSSSIIFMLVATSLGRSLSRETLKSHFALVAYEPF